MDRGGAVYSRWRDGWDKEFCGGFMDVRLEIKSKSYHFLSPYFYCRCLTKNVLFNLGNIIVKQVLCSGWKEEKAEAQ